MLGDSSIDLRYVAILTNAEALPPLTGATEHRLVVERGGYRIEASSPGSSLLVLPVEYSHCLRSNLTSSSPTPPKLLRANLALAAILFTDDVRGELQLRYGPLSSSCRMEDWREADSLKISDVREWPQQ